MITNTTCPHCDHIFPGSQCPTCGYTAKQAARERVYQHAPCDFCPAPWKTQWVDWEAAGVRYVCAVHHDPSTWLADVRPRYQYAPILLESMAQDPGVHVHRIPPQSSGNGPRSHDHATVRPTHIHTMAAQVAEKLAEKEDL